MIPPVYSLVSTKRFNRLNYQIFYISALYINDLKMDVFLIPQHG